MNTSNKRLKIGASFPGFYLTFLTPRLAKALPSDTLSNSGQSLPANTCLFHPTDGESHPSRLRASISSQVTASASRPPNFTFPSSPVRQRVLIARRTPARASRTDNFTFSNLLLNEAHPSDTAISKPVGRRQEPTGQSNLSFPFCGRQKPTQPRCRLTARLSDHLTLPFRLILSNSVSPDLSRRMPVRALPARQSSLFKSTLVEATVRHDDPETTVGREPPS